jgi:hypothetical protein
MLIKYQSTRPAAWVRSEYRTSCIPSWNDKYSRVTFGLLVRTLQFWDTCSDDMKNVARFTENLLRN